MGLAPESDAASSASVASRSSRLSPASSGSGSPGTSKGGAQPCLWKQSTYLPHVVGYGGGLVGSASGLLTVGRMTRLLGVPWPVDTQSIGAVTERSHSRGYRASNRSGTLQQQSGARKARSASQRNTLVGSNPRSTSPSSDCTQCPVCQRDGLHQYAMVCEQRSERRPITALQGQTYLDARQRYVHHAVIKRLRVKERVSGLHRLWCSDV